MWLIGLASSAGPLYHEWDLSDAMRQVPVMMQCVCGRLSSVQWVCSVSELYVRLFVANSLAGVWYPALVSILATRSGLTACCSSRTTNAAGQALVCTAFTNP